MVVAITDEALVTINSLEVVGIIYLAIWLSRLRSDLSKLEGKFEQYTSNHKSSNGKG